MRFYNVLLLLNVCILAWRCQRWLSCVRGWKACANSAERKADLTRRWGEDDFSRKTFKVHTAAESDRNSPQANCDKISSKTNRSDSFCYVVRKCRDQKTNKAQGGRIKTVHTIITKTWLFSAILCQTLSMMWWLLEGKYLCPEDSKFTAVKVVGVIEKYFPLLSMTVCH